MKSVRGGLILAILFAGLHFKDFFLSGRNEGIAFIAVATLADFYTASCGFRCRSWVCSAVSLIIQCKFRISSPQPLDPTKNAYF